MEEKTKEKRGGSGVGDTIKMNVGSLNENWIQTWDRGEIKNMSGNWYAILYLMHGRLLGVMGVKSAE